MLRTGFFALALTLGFTSWDALSAIFDRMAQQNIPWTDSHLHG